jgi:hypothetical protein
MMWFLSGIGKVPTPNVHSDVWDCVESIRMLLACRLKIIPTSNLKLIISFLVLHIVLLSFTQVVIACCLNLARSPNLACLLEAGQQVSAQFANSSNKNNLQAAGTGAALSASQGRVLVVQDSRHGKLRTKVPLLFLLLFTQHKKSRKLLLTSYLLGSNFNGSSTKHHILLSRN